MKRPVRRHRSSPAHAGHAGQTARPQRRFDTIVLGVGGMGSAAVYNLARRGQKVLGLERFDIPHAMGSSHGLTRIIRLAYYEHPSYVPLLRRAYELWRDLQKKAGEKLLHITGSIDAAPVGSGLFEDSLKSCQLHRLKYEALTGEQLRWRCPGFQLPDSHLCLFQPDGGFLLPERCIVNYVTLAQAKGAEIHAREQVLHWEASPRGNGVRVHTDRGDYQADRLVIAAGAWSSKLIRELRGKAQPERQVLGWFQPAHPKLFLPERFPVFNLLVDEGRFYGFPLYGVPGVKIGLYHHLNEQVDPETMNRECGPRDEAPLREALEKYFPDAAGPLMALKSCLFTNSPDEHFILDTHPRYEQVAIAAGFSGHGFKFCSVVGEILADLALNGRTKHDLSMFRFARFKRARAAADAANGKPASGKPSRAPRGATPTLPGTAPLPVRKAAWRHATYKRKRR
ncbi:MAG: N-methyl-L-tryptophan oxidase [Planctomycetota bacterium]